MAHIQRDRRKLVARINRVISQLEAVRTLLEEDEGDEQRCFEVMRQLSSIKGAHRGLMTAYFEGFVSDHMRSAADSGTIDEFTDELLEVVRSFQT
jgi:DNA-binding FrmR family transcriptional regulator